LIAKFLHKYKLDGIRNQILLFAVLSALVPSGLTAWIAYSQNRRALETRLSRELGSTSSQGAREVNLWIKDRFSDLRSLGGSYIIKENLERVGRGAGGPAAVRRLNDYLNSVRTRMGEYGELVILDGAGRPVATTAQQARPLPLPGDWTRTLRTEERLVG
jgi:hypothetical protein